MSRELLLPDGYTELLDPQHTEKAIAQIKEVFQTNLAFELDLQRVTAPLFVESGTGVNDDLNGVERPVAFPVKELDDKQVEIVQSLAKWKRMALADLGFESGSGLYTDMNALRPDEELSNIHSIYVDQWDWEKVVTREDRNLEYLKQTVRKIYDVIRRTEKYISHEYEHLQPNLPEDIHFVHAEELEEMYPNATPKEREYNICRSQGAVFVIGIGGQLPGGDIHDGRAPDYDDWSTPNAAGYKGLNGDILVYNPVLDIALELSSMGLRVDKAALEHQLEISGQTERREFYFHQRLLNDELPLSIGGGIGQSRLCMLFLQKAHIGEIQSSLWPDKMREQCRQNGIFLL
ncbi:MAG: aspartate--ammonia ligase [Lentisphaeria bacterium]